MPISATTRMKLAMGAHPSRLESAFYAARAEAAIMRQALRQLDLQCAAAWELLNLTTSRIPWPPAPAPLRPPTLHEAMRAALELHDNHWITCTTSPPRSPSAVCTSAATAAPPPPRT